MKPINLHTPKPGARRLRRRSAWAFFGAFMVLAVVIASFALVEFHPTGSLANWGEVGVLTLLMLLFIVLLVAGGMNAHEAACAGRIERGEGVHARWTVDPKSWQELGEQRRALDQEPGAIRTYPPMPIESPPGGVEIIICRDGLFIGPEFRHPLPPLPVLQPRLVDHWLELDCLEAMPSHVVRLPVPPEARLVIRRLLLNCRPPPARLPA